MYVIDDVYSVHVRLRDGKVLNKKKATNKKVCDLMDAAMLATCSETGLRSGGGYGSTAYKLSKTGKKLWSKSLPGIICKRICQIKAGSAFFLFD